MKSGFTLMEVCVAMAVFSIGFLGINSVLGNFYGQQRQERIAAEDYLCHVAAMEQLVKNPPSCSNRLIFILAQSEGTTCSTEAFSLRTVPAGTGLTIAENSRFRRLVRCR